MGKRFGLLLMLSVLTFTVFAQDATENISNAMCQLYDFFKNILPIAVVLAIVFAGIIFVVGQLLGAETRAKSNVWAQNIIIYTVIAVILVLLVPTIIKWIDPSMDLETVCG